jgi:hypothetical protein
VTVLTLIVFLPALAAAALLAVTERAPARVFTGTCVAVGAVDLALVAVA